MSNLDSMLKQLRTGLREMDKAKAVQDQLVGELISKLPEDKRKEANLLLSKARKGKANINEIMNFAGNMRKEDKEDLKKSVEKVTQKADDLKDK